MVERSLSMREVPGSIPGASNLFLCPKNPYLFHMKYSKNGVGRFQVGEIHEMKKDMEDPGIDPGTSRMLSERSTI